MLAVKFCSLAVEPKLEHLEGVLVHPSGLWFEVSVPTGLCSQWASSLEESQLLKKHAQLRLMCVFNVAEPRRTKQSKRK